MKKLLLFLFVFLWLVTFAFAQGASVSSGGSNAVIPKQTKKVGFVIDPLNKADIKALDDAMKPFEDYAKEYNRLVGLRDRIYQTLIRAKGIDIKELTELPIITADSINLILNAEPKAKK